MASTETSAEGQCFQEDNYQYNMGYKNIGKCLIINNKHFLDMNARYGTEKDERKLKEAFGSLGFLVQVENDLSSDGMRQILQTVSREDHSEMASFVCVILSHGEQGLIYGTDREVKIRELTTLISAMNCPTLRGKPKLFFIQACRGDELDSGIEADSVTEECLEITEIPEEDFLCAHSTSEGYFAWRSPVFGSVFITRLCEMLNQNGRDLEIASILTRVNHQVALKFESNTPSDPSSHRKKQMPCFISKLTKELYLHK